LRDTFSKRRVRDVLKGAADREFSGSAFFEMPVDKWDSSVESAREPKRGRADLIVDQYDIVL